MTIILYVNKSDSNHVYKNIEELVTLSGALRDTSSIISPTIAVEDPNALVANYAYIQEFRRYYYIENVSVTPTGLYTLSLSVDVLMSFKNYFTQLSGIIARQENLYNLYLDDDKFLVNAQRMYVTKQFPNKVPAANTTGSKPFIITLAGGGTGVE